MSNKQQGRYTVPTNEDIEPGSNEGVLKNYARVTSKTTMDALERLKLKEAASILVKDPHFGKEHQFTAQDICDIHQLWLGDIYPFAGQYRTVTMSKEEFPFASPSQIHKLMRQFEQEYLKRYTPCTFDDTHELAHALAVVHVELILIHPFREGNGRVARLLANLMIMQADKQPIDFTLIEPEKHLSGFNEYIAAIHAGLERNYAPIQTVFLKLIESEK